MNLAPRRTHAGRAPRPIGASLGRRRSGRDGKVERLRASWLQPSRRAATRLAQLADLIDVAAGTVLAPGRFAYIGLDEQHAGLVVADGTATVGLTSRAELLVLGEAAFEEMARSIATIGDAWRRATGHGRGARTTAAPVETATSPDASSADRLPGAGARVASGRPLGLTPAGAPRSPDIDADLAHAEQGVRPSGVSFVE